MGAHGLTFEGLRLTLEAHGVTLGAFELQFSSPWGHLGVILVAIGSMLGSLWLDRGRIWLDRGRISLDRGAFGP